MKNRVVWAFVVLCSVSLIFGGCAKQEVLKKDEAIAPSTAVQPKQINGNSAKTGDGITTATVKEAPLAPRNTEAVSAKAEQLQAALKKIYFDYDASTLSEQARTNLVKNVEVMQKNPVAKVQIQGHCDERGSDEYNLALGERRAKAAMQYMVTMGIPEKRLSVISYGKEKPSDTGHDEAALARNRRDEFVVVTK